MRTRVCLTGRGECSLQPGALLNKTTWVFGKVIEYLKQRGYTERSLKAAPYDWRLPPQFQESRDGYFSRTCRMIEREHEETGGRPVVLLAHSMGNNMAHYFLNWVQQHGQSAKAIHGPASAWLEKHGECGVRSTHWPL
jgi:hypothetical protein